MNNNLKYCSVCGGQMDKKIERCPHCGAMNRKPFYKSFWFWFLVLILIGIVNSPSESSSNNTNKQESSKIEETLKKENDNKIKPIKSVFEGDSGVRLSAEIKDNEYISSIVEMDTRIQNTTDKDINAIEFYIVYYDVYGDKINNILDSNHLFSDSKILANNSNTITYTFMNSKVYSADLYLYSVYYEDGSSWGNKDASKLEILENAPLIKVKKIK